MNATLTSPRLAYRDLLTQHRDAMVTGLVEKHHLDRGHAERMIDQLWRRLTDRLVTDFAHLGVDQAMAERIMNEALGFLSLCANTPGHGPSPMVDLGWHTIQLYSFEYDVFCHAIAGFFLHHAPTDVIGPDGPDNKRCRCNYKCANKCMNKCSSCTPRPGRNNASQAFPDSICIVPGQKLDHHFSTQDTVAAMQQLGPVDLELWTANV